MRVTEHLLNSVQDRLILIILGLEVVNQLMKLAEESSLSLIHLALGFVLSGLTVQHWALLRRQMRFSAIAGLETAADIAAFAVAIALALAGKGYWALVAQRLVAPG